MLGFVVRYVEVEEGRRYINDRREEYDIVPVIWDDMAVSYDSCRQQLHILGVFGNEIGWGSPDLSQPISIYSVYEHVVLPIFKYV